MISLFTIYSVELLGISFFVSLMDLSVLVLFAVYITFFHVHVSVISILTL